MSEISVDKYKRAYHDLMMKKAVRDFRVHATIYAVVNAGLVTVNLLTVPQVPWSIYPLVGWGVGLAIHHYFGLRRYPEQLASDELEAERLAREY
jgi:hypothetical protein